MREFITCSTLTPREWMKSRMKRGMSWAGIRSGRTQVSSANGTTWEMRSLRDGWVVIKEGANRLRSIQRNQSMVFLSLPP